jgi:cobalt/nickel transport protein
MIDNKTFIIAGVIIALIVGCLAVFLASGDPDGLESTALVVSGQKDLTGLSPSEGDPEEVGTGTFSYQSPLPDYSIPDMGTGGALVASFIGILITLCLVVGVSWLIRLSKSSP